MMDLFEEYLERRKDFWKPRINFYPLDGSDYMDSPEFECWTECIEILAQYREFKNNPDNYKKMFSSLT